MDEATKQALNTFVQQMITAAQDGTKWTADQAPLVVQEWLRWRAVEEALWIVMGVALFAAVWKMSARVMAASKGLIDDDPVVVGWAIRVIFGGPVLILTTSWVSALAKVLVAPRVVVLEKFMELVK